MINGKIGTKSNQIKSFKSYVYDPLFPDNDPNCVCRGPRGNSIDKNIRVPIGDINELRKKLKGK